MTNNNLPSINQLKRAVQIQEQITKLQDELRSVLSGGSGYTGAKRGPKPKGAKIAEEGAASGGRSAAKKKRVMSAEAREKIAAAQKRRWAKQKRAAK